MKFTYMMKKLAAGFICSAFMLSAIAQETDNWLLQKSSVVIKGTSSAHDWEMKAQKVQAQFTGVKESQKLQEVNGAKLKINSSTISSDNNTMDNKAHDALKVNKHPEITFTANNLKNVSHNGNTFQATIVGNLNLAGKSRQVAIPIKGKYLDDSNLKIESQYSLNMSDYGIDPPTAMLGALKTGDKVTLEFDLQFSRSSSSTAKK